MRFLVLVADLPSPPPPGLDLVPPPPPPPPADDDQGPSPSRNAVDGIALTADEGLLRIALVPGGDAVVAVELQNNGTTATGCVQSPAQVDPTQPKAQRAHCLHTRSTRNRLRNAASRALRTGRWS
jgi:hypothetical protein